MFKDFKIQGNVDAEYKNKPFTIEFQGDKAIFRIPDMETLQVFRELLEPLQEDTEEAKHWKNLIKQMNTEIYLEEDLIAKSGKDAKPNMFSKMMKLDFIEIQPGKLMGKLF